MAKVTLDPRTLLYPLPTVLVGANVDGKANFMAAAWCGIVNSNPPMLSVSLQHQRHTLKGITLSNQPNRNKKVGQIPRLSPEHGVVGE